MVENDWEGNILFDADSISLTKGKDGLIKNGIMLNTIMDYDFHVAKLCSGSLSCVIWAHIARNQIALC